jgi:histidine triad (HIT) family protein
MGYTYDTENIFAKILRGEIPNDTVLETDHALAFRDIAPQAPDHVLVISKGPYVNFDHFMAEASEAEILDFNRAISRVIEQLKLAPSASVDGGGYRIISNSGKHGMQDVPHLHVHILAGRKLGVLVQPVD